MLACCLCAPLISHYGLTRGLAERVGDERDDSRVSRATQAPLEQERDKASGATHSASEQAGDAFYGQQHDWYFVESWLYQAPVLAQALPSFPAA